MDDKQRSMEEVAAAAAGSGSKRFVNLTRFTALLIDQTIESKLTPEEMRFVAGSYRNSIELIIAEQRHQ